MTAHAVTHPHLHRPSPGTRLRATANELRARAHATSLDRQLAAGVPTWRTPLHAVRALQLTGPRRRRRLAAALDILELRSLQSLRTGSVLCLRVVPCRTSVRGCAAELEELVELLRGDQPVSAQGVAQLQQLLSNGAGPLYVPGCGDALGRELARARSAMAVCG